MRSQGHRISRARALAAAAMLVVLSLLLTAQACSHGPVTDTGPSRSTTAGPSTTTRPSITEAPLVRIVVGSSVLGRPIELFSAGSGITRVLIIGGIHGDELGGDVAWAFMRYLRDHPEAIPQGLALDIIPSANPDGEAAGTRANARGVDLNRNFPAGNWSSTLQTGDTPARDLTGGEAAGSEPETKAVLACLERGYEVVIALHSEGGLVDFDGPGGKAIAQRMADLCGLPVRHLAYQQQVTGSLGAFVPERYSIPVVTVELESAELTPGLLEALLGAG